MQILLILIIWPVAKFSMTNPQSVHVIFRTSTKESKISLVITFGYRFRDLTVISLVLAILSDLF